MLEIVCVILIVLFGGFLFVWAGKEIWKDISEILDGTWLEISSSSFRYLDGEKENEGISE